MSFDEVAIDDIPAKYGAECQDAKKTDDLKSRYCQMIAELMKPDEKNQKKILLNYEDLFDEMFVGSSDFLAVYDDDFYFFRRNNKNIVKLSNFGAIVLNVTHIHEIEGKKYELKLLVISKDDNAKITNVDSLSLTSRLWIEELDVSFKYYSISSIQDSIKTMTEFAPSTKEYDYSGWSTEEPDTYIFGGNEICAKE